MMMGKTDETVMVKIALRRVESALGSGRVKAADRQYFEHLAEKLRLARPDMQVPVSLIAMK
jgi:hypothetical protein